MVYKLRRDLKQRKLFKSALICLSMDKTYLNSSNIFISKVRGKENSKTIQIPDSVCDFCDINLGDLMKLEIIETKKGKNGRKRK